DLVAVRERDLEPAVLLAEHRAADLAGAIFQRPVEMPGGRARQVRDLALDPDHAEAALDQEPRLAVQRGDGVDRPGLAERELEGFTRRAHRGGSIPAAAWPRSACV